MRVLVYGKEHCGKCHSAKDKLERMGVEYEYHDLHTHLLIGHDEWRETGDVDLLAHCAMRYQAASNGHHWPGNVQAPQIKIDDEFYEYQEAMKVVKKIVKGQVRTK